MKTGFIVIGVILFLIITISWKMNKEQKDAKIKKRTNCKCDGSE